MVYISKYLIPRYLNEVPIVASRTESRIDIGQTKKFRRKNLNIIASIFISGSGLKEGTGYR